MLDPMLKCSDGVVLRNGYHFEFCCNMAHTTCMGHVRAPKHTWINNLLAEPRLFQNAQAGSFAYAGNSKICSETRQELSINEAPNI